MGFPVFGTRSPGEKEDAEADRLVRPAPKVKPPRHDRRRERMETDTEDDPDLKSKDRSMNYKTIGGSVVERVVERYATEHQSIRKDRRSITVRNKETGKIVFVSPKTLRENANKYEKYKPEKKGPGEAGKATPLQPPRPDSKKPPPEAKPGEEAPKPKPKPPRPRPKPPAQKPAEAAPEPAIAGDPAPPAPEGSETAKQPKPAKGEKPASPEGAESEKEPSGDAGKGEEGAREQQELPVAKKLGIEAPKRRESTSAERAEAALLLADHLPPELAAKLIASGIHPDDAKTLVGSYRAAKNHPTGDVGEFASKAAGFFETDPDRVPPPKSWKDSKGEKVAFEKLSPDEKASAYRQHQMQVVAASLAAQHQLEEQLSFGGTVPPMVSKVMTRTLLGKVSDAATPSIAEKLFELTASSKDFAKISEGHTRQMLASVKGSDGARRLLESYLKANDYKRAKALYLDDRLLKDDKFPELKRSSERDKPGKILKSLEAARDFFKVQGRLYGSDDGHEGSKHFETKVLGQLREVSPEKYKVVRRALDQRDAQAYRLAQKEYRREFAAYEHAHKKWQKNPFGDVEPKAPKEPVEPIGYSNAKNSDDLASEGKQLWRDLEERAATAKTAARVASKFLISSYLSGTPMQRTSIPRGRHALYHGVDPGEHYRESYPKWSPVPSRDLAESDRVAILSAAKIWLDAPVATQGVEGLDAAQKARQALDLALSDGHYRVDATAYEALLAKLQGTRAPRTVKLAAEDRGRLERAVYAKFPPGSKRKSGGRPTVMLEGAAAKRLRRPEFSLVALSELSIPELETLATTVRVVTSSFEEPQSDNRTAARDSARDSRKPDNGVRQMLRLSSEQKTSANQILASFDQLAQSIQENYQKWGMAPEAARKLVNHLDRTADSAEAFFFGENSLQARQAEVVLASEDFRRDALESGLMNSKQIMKAARVIQRDSDEAYMDTFKNPMSPIDTNSDEPYMSAYGDDQSSAVVDGEDDTGRDLAPEA